MRGATWFEVEPFYYGRRLRFRLVAKSDGTRPPSTASFERPNRWRTRAQAQKIADKWNAS